MGEVKLLASDLSLFCIRIEWALKLKGVNYEHLKEDLKNKSDVLLKYNPVYKKVPVLVHDGKPISESLIILEYIDETWKQNPLLPQDPCGRAMARFWAKFADEKCFFEAIDACWQEGEKKEKTKESAMVSFAFLEEQIKGKKFFNGENIGYLDLALGWIPHWLNVLEEVGGMKLVDAHKFPSLHEWTQNFTEIPLIKECLPPRDQLVDYITGCVRYMRSLEANKQ